MISDISSIDLRSNYWVPTGCQALWRESGLSQVNEIPGVPEPAS